MDKFLSIISITALLFLCSCSDNNDEPAKTGTTAYTRVELSENARIAEEACNKFAFEILNYTETVTDNIAFSPISIFTTWSAFANSDRDDSNAELLELLGLSNSDSSIDQINAFAHEITTAFPKLDNSVTFISSNAAFHDNRFELNENFTNRLSEIYGESNFTVIPLENSGNATKEINNWVKGNTNGKITNLINPNDEQSQIKSAIVNAIYFKGPWSSKFDSNNTKTGNFTNCDGSSSKVLYMSKSVNGRYMNNEFFEGAELSMGNGQYSMLFFIPKEKSYILSYDDYYNMVESYKYEVAEDNYMTRMIHLSLPKFKTEYRISNLMDIMPSEKIYSIKNTGFSGVYKDVSEKFTISPFVSAVTLSIDENGAEASASSAALDIYTDAGNPGEVVLNFNHPFFYVICESSTGSIIVMGKINKL